VEREEVERNAAIWTAYIHGQSQAEIAEQYGISQPRVSQIVKAVRETIPQEDRAERALRELAFLDDLRSQAMKIVAMEAPPVTAGKDGAIVRDPEHKGPDGQDAIVRDHAGRLAAMSQAVAISAHVRRLLGLDAPTRTEVTGGVRHELVGVDPEDLK
jgi:hypothetical protein